MIADRRHSRLAPPLPSEDLREALADSEARYTALAERVAYGVYRSSPAGRFIEANSLLAAMLGYDDASQLMTLDLAVDVYLDPCERERLIAAAPASEYPDWVETRWKRRDGTAITVRLAIRACRDATGAVVAYDGLVEDVTERQRRDELLRRSERMASLGTTLAGVAHEINNPLAAIMGFAQLLLRKAWPAEERAALETINSEAMRSATIVKDLLAIARKRDVARRGATDVNDIVGYTLRTRRYSLETTGIQCSVELDPSLPVVQGDRAQLEQVMRNLLSNAEHALRARADAPEPRTPPRITLRTRRAGSDAVIEIEDNGPGIPENVRAQIWDPFWTTKEEGEGTGLGLAVVYAIVVDHGGSVAFEPAEPTGARFVVRLPLAADAAPRTSVLQAPRSLDVLVVDPGATDLAFVERFLTARGHAVINAGSGDLALRLGAQTSFDAVVCDARLRAGDGRLVSDALRETRGCAAARFVLSAPNTPQPDELPAADGGRFVSRPYDVEELRRLIEGD